MGYSPGRVEDATTLLRRIQKNPYIREKPFEYPGSPMNHPRQALYAVAPEKEVLYGGAAGGGKSSGLLMAALLYVDVPGYTALLLRKSFPQLEMSLMKRAREWLADTDARWSEQKKTWTFPSGATLRFGHMGDRNARYDYQGAEFDFVGYDELTQFTQEDYEYLFSRIRRRDGSTVPLRMRAGSNPGGTGGEWVKQKFLVEVKPGERRFIPATLDDNPFLDKAEYEKSLAELDPVTYEQLRWGRWDVSPSGGWFKPESFEVVDAAPECYRRVRYWDFAASGANTGGDPDWTVGALVGVDRDGTYYVLDIQRDRLKPDGIEKLLRSTANHDGHRVEIVIEQEPGSSGIIVADHYRRKVVPGYSFWAERATGSKVERAKPASAAAAGELIKIVRAGWNRAFLEELRVFPQEGWHDDQVDAFSGAFGRLAKGHGSLFADAWERMAEVSEAEKEAEIIEAAHREDVAAEANRMLRRVPRQA